MTAHERKFTVAPYPGSRAARSGLSTWTESGAIEAALAAMARKTDLPHWGSRGAINRAGEAIRLGSLTGAQALALESWRMAHRDVIHAFEALLRQRAKNQEVQVAQRLKRRSTIVDKLSRHPQMQLARMDDVAGCRLIFPSIAALHSFRDKVHLAKFKHVRKNEKHKYDYIDKPTDRGYRGIHDIYEYRARDGKSKKCEGLLIEVQYRTSVQHAWATAVEVVTQMTAHQPKFNRGDPRYVRLFCLASEMLARTHEGMSARHANLSNKELLNEFDILEDGTGVMEMLFDLVLHEWIGKRAEADHVILQISKDKGFQLHQFDLELEASKRLLELEKQFPDDDIVLVGAKTAEEITSAFRNYFNDVREFMNLMNLARKALTKN